MINDVIAELKKNLRLLPGIGDKTAQRLAMHLITQDKQISLNLSQAINDAVERIKECSVCNMLTESDPCKFCNDPGRDSAKLCIVESTQDVFIIENTHEYKGMYFVLGCLISPLDGIGPAEIHFKELEQRINNNEIEEIILALNPSAEGESTINFLAHNLSKHLLKLTRLSTGIPFGGDIVYSSSITLSNAFRRRYSV